MLLRKISQMGPYVVGIDTIFVGRVPGSRRDRGLSARSDLSCPGSRTTEVADAWVQAQIPRVLQMPTR